jgi:hypothetical protein
MKDPHPYVRDTTAWTIGRVFEFQHDAGNTDVPELITRETLPQVAQVRLRCGALEVLGLKHLDASCCWLLLGQPGSPFLCRVVHSLVPVPARVCFRNWVVMSGVYRQQHCYELGRACTLAADWS